MREKERESAREQETSMGATAMKTAAALLFGLVVMAVGETNNHNDVVKINGDVVETGEVLQDDDMWSTATRVRDRLVLQVEQVHISISLSRATSARVARHGGCYFRSPACIVCLRRLR